LNSEKLYVRSIITYDSTEDDNSVLSIVIPHFL